ncbi:MAG: FkbM family methyltransferase [Ginsengibacter sp.]
MISKRKLNKLLERFGVEIHGKGYLQSLAKGDFKRDCFQVQADFIETKRPVIFDIGANRGTVVETYLNYFPDATIYAFEPFPDSFDMLKNRFASQKNVHCVESAVASSKGLKEFFVNRNVDTNSLLKPQKTGLRSDEQVNNTGIISVDTLILDDFCKAKGIDHMHILKMDIQGGEFDALKGLHNMLSHSAIDLIYSEVYFIQQYEGQPLFHDISALLFKYGYQLQDIYTPIYGNNNLAWADVIFRRIK